MRVASRMAGAISFNQIEKAMQQAVQKEVKECTDKVVSGMRSASCGPLQQVAKDAEEVAQLLCDTLGVAPAKDFLERDQRTIDIEALCRWLQDATPRTRVDALPQLRVSA